jgi:hypothetical protein
MKIENKFRYVMLEKRSKTLGTGGWDCFAKATQSMDNHPYPPKSVNVR